jgi:hypothetical protein
MLASDVLLAEQVRSVVDRLLGEKAGEASELFGGRNSKVFKLECRSGRAVVAKVNLRVECAIAEFTALDFLWQRGVNAIPQPLALEEATGIGIYRFIDGVKLTPAEVGPSEIDQAKGFLMELWAMAREEDCKFLPWASDACLTAQAIFDSIEDRIARLIDSTGEGPIYDQFYDFLRSELSPELNACREWCQRRLELGGGLLAAPIEDRHVTLSPSDFGFHNILRRADGRLVFIDFEHFGRDDPAKMVVDFLLHPHKQMAIHQDMKQRLYKTLIDDIDPGGEWLGKRVATLLPLFGLKWCTILLNEFSAEQLARRLFVRSGMEASGTLLTRQLAKAKLMLSRSRCARDPSYRIVTEKLNG